MKLICNRSRTVLGFPFWWLFLVRWIICSTKTITSVVSNESQKAFSAIRINLTKNIFVVIYKLKHEHTYKARVFLPIRPFCPSLIFKVKTYLALFEHTYGIELGKCGKLSSLLPKFVNFFKKRNNL